MDEVDEDGRKRRPKQISIADLAGCLRQTYIVSTIHVYTHFLMLLELYVIFIDKYN